MNQEELSIVVLGDDVDEIDLFVDELEDRYNASVVSSLVTGSSFGSFGTSSASCACTVSCFCSSG